MLKPFALLNDLEDPEFKDLFFSQAEANNVCCEDRSAMSLNEIYTSWLLLCKSPNLPEKEKLRILAGVAKTLRLRKKVDAMIAQEERKRKKENPAYQGEVESVEIFLYYETALKQELQLETAIQTMKYSTIGKRSWIDQAALIQDVKENFYEELINIPIFEKMMQKEWEPITAEFQKKLAALGDRPKGKEEDPLVLNYNIRQGEIMQEWKNKKIEAAKKI